ncbi:leucyl aminopeptidase family protein [Actinophytocola sp.]|uniref:leucyl aminopeptidase family protein n=1 Tax=Actinophytocola sp. TaxID=1872138 RepID=UPI002D7F84B3|nr:leucyl aminopeptidase family protein [Actinophytocola sp.]HET9143528.1 leucyl aminopeptidase family protein [Actinophytocola sp.]
MPTPLPALPTPLPDIEVDVQARGPAAVMCRPGQDGPPRIGPGGGGITEEWIAAAGVTGKAGEVHIGPMGAAARWVVGLGAGGLAQWRGAGAALVRAVHSRLAADADAGRRPDRAASVWLPADAEPAEVAALVRGLCLGGYEFKVASAAPKPKLRTIRLVVGADRQAELAGIARRSATLAAATALARDLANTPSNVKDPAWLARMATRTAGGVAGLRVEVRDEHWLARHGFGGMLAVGGGSTRPPRLVELSWHPKGATTHLILVGKGITFDTGGISVKQAEGMHLMRTDMAGGAAVIAALAALARFAVGVRVTGLVACAENHMSGSAYRPGDVVRHYGGRTTEVTNTDAEGRMVLADALAYAVARLRPDVLVDVATLTGAMKVSLGMRTGGLFASHDDLAERVRRAGDRVGEAWWRMPLPDDMSSLAAELADAVPSDIADVRQCPPGPSGITAAAFLREFTAGLPWAHLDIAGPARADKIYDDVVPGATGFAARTLVELVSSYAVPN